MNAERNQRDEQMHWAEFPDIGELLWNEKHSIGNKRHRITYRKTINEISEDRFLTWDEIDRIDRGEPVYSRWCHEIHDRINDKRYVAEGHEVDMPLGEWVVWSDDGEEFKGAYKDGKRHGLWFWRNPSGKEVKVKFRNGKFVKLVE
ncbi:MAG: hypothetical protein OXU62_11500 [Gammaproteobacteria bacterium]|nr:hypothetical protein [Gammaproteobacteria bacterium]